jgi:hypothetical protein
MIPIFFCQEKIKDLSSWKAILLMQNHTIEHDYRSYRYRLYRTIREIRGMDRNGEKLVDFFSTGSTIPSRPSGRVIRVTPSSNDIVILLASC